MIDGPSAVMVYLRAGWSLGNVPDRYIFPGAGGDQLVGRFVTLLPPNKPEFASLPPHFTSEGLNVLQRIGFSRLVPGYQYIPAPFKRVIPYLIAALLHHETWLKEKFKESHPLWRSPFFTLNMQERAQLKPHVVSGCFDNPVTLMQATGIPGYITMCQELASVKNDLKNQNAELMSMFKEHNQLMIKLFDEQPEKLREYLVKHFTGLGDRSATHDDIRLAVADLKSYIDSRLPPPGSQGSTSSASSANADTQSRSIVDDGVANNVWDTDGSVKQMQHFWGGQFRYYCCDISCTSAIHRIAEVRSPHTFEFNNMPLKQAFQLWYLGNEDTCTGPYRRIAGNHTVAAHKTNTFRKDLSSAKRAINELHKIALEQHVSKNTSVPNAAATFRITKDNWSEVFDAAFEVLERLIYANGGNKEDRKSQLTVNAFCNQLSKHGRNNNGTTL